MSKVKKKGIEMGHMTSLGEERRDCLVGGPEEGGWSEQRDREEDDQKMRSDIRHLVFYFCKEVQLLVWFERFQSLILFPYKVEGQSYVLTRGAWISCSKGFSP